jgi:protein TonB
VRATHPRQTLIQPDAPLTPPKVVPALPNIVQWTVFQPKVRPVLPPTESAPRMKQRAARDLAAPEIANAEKNSGQINILSTPVVNAQPKLPMIPTSARAAARIPKNENAAAAAPDINAATSNEADLRRVIALSATPAPPAPQVSLPEGNLAARISISPDGQKPGAPASLGHSAAAGGPGATHETSGAESGMTEGLNGSGSMNSLPAAVSISGANSKSGSGGIAPSGNYSERLSLKPTAPSLSAAAPRTSPVVTSNFDPNMPPEKILSGKEVYTMHVNAPNFTSASGSWIMNFVQLDEDINPPYKPKGVLSGPVATHLADPKYPSSLIQQHVRGEVILYAIIRKDGSIDSIQLVRGLDPELDRNAIDALGQWKFRPGTRAGVPVDIEAVIHVPFLYGNP